jgi:hypothetical protein
MSASAVNRETRRDAASSTRGASNQPHLSLIVKLYERYADKKPVMLFDIQEQRIYAMPYAEYRADLSKRSQASLKKQYERAIADGEMVVFVRDNEKEKLVSYSLPL